ncbi:MAG: hypothetical protein Q9227_001766 [Pyrenula ochraceoflavens]
MFTSEANRETQSALQKNLSLSTFHQPVNIAHSAIESSEPSFHSSEAEWQFPKVSYDDALLEPAARETNSSIQTQNESLTRALYDDLPSKAWFRLLFLEPSQNFSSPMFCRLKAFQRTQMKLKYETLSYAWREGEGEGETYPANGCHDYTDQRLPEVLCNGIRISIQKNLALALLRIRDRSRPRALWVDAICIDQKNIFERTQQTQVMSEIYSQSYRTIVWLGLARMSPTRRESKKTHDKCGPESALATICDLINDAPEGPAKFFALDDAQSHMNVRAPSPSEAADSISSGGSPDQSHSDSQAYGTAHPLECLFRSSWFRRKWVIQEVVLSRQVDVVFHDFRIDWNWIGLASAILRTLDDDFIQRHRLFNMYNAYLIFRLGRSTRLNQSFPLEISFLQLLRLTAAFKTSEEKDTVFALLGLQTTDHHPQDSPLIRTDYSKTFDHVRILLTKAMLSKGKDGSEPLAVLLNAGIAAQDLVALTENPSIYSWVPRWGSPMASLLSPWSLDDNFNASADLESKTEDSQSPSLLNLNAVIFTTIASTTIPIRNQDDIRRSVCQFLYALQSFKEGTDAPWLVEAMLSTLCAGRTSYGMRIPKGQHPVQPFIEFVASGKLPKVEAASELLALRKPPPTPKRGKQRRRKFARLAITICRGRRLFMTTDGHLGLGPAALESGDIVSVLGGARMPYVLRHKSGPERKDRSRVVLVGPCYIDGLMDGEVVAAMKHGKRHFGPFSDIQRVRESAATERLTKQEIEIE